MKILIKWFLAIVFITALLITSAFTRCSEGKETNETQKVITVVLDNSTSMVRDDPAKSQKDYTNRWIEADYAVRALAAMMNSGDILKVYPLNGKELINIKIPKKNEMYSNAYKTLYDGLDHIKYYGRTPFDKVDTAARDLKNEKKKECFLVVITDGNFKDYSNTNKGKDLSKKEMKEKFNKVLKISNNFLVKCIPIGKNVDISIPVNDRISVYNSKSNEDGVIYQITDVINEIYNRVAMNENSIEKLVKKTKENLKITFDIPVKSVTIFFQSKKAKKNEWESVEYSNSNNVIGTSIIFNGTEKKPETLWASREKLKKNWIKSLSLSGMVLTYNLSGNDKSNSITIENLPYCNDNDIQVYYEPAIDYKITIQPENSESFIYGESRSIFTRGKMGLKIEYVDLNGNILENQASSLLKTNDVEVKIDKYKCKFDKNKKGIYTYFATINDSDKNKNIIITNKIGLNDGKKSIKIKKIYEPDVELSIKLFDKDLLKLNKNGNANLNISLLNKKTNKLLTKQEWNKQIALECKSKYFKTYSKKYAYKADGKISIPVSLNDLDQHKIDSDIFDVSITKNYSDEVRVPVSAKKSFNINITSVPHTLKIEIEKKPMQVWRLLLFGGELPIKYYCDGQELDSKQRKDVNASLVLNNSSLDGMVSLKGCSIQLLKTYKWIFFENKKCQITIPTSYEKWNKNAHNNDKITLYFIPINPVIRNILITIFLIIFLFLLCKIIWIIFLSKRRRDYISWKTKFYFKSGDERIEDTYLEWPWYNKVIFLIKYSKKRYVCLKNIKRDKSDTIPDKIILYISKSINDTNNWNIVKLKKIIPLAQLDINGANINENNNIFDNNNNILTIHEVANNNNKQKLHIEEINKSRGI